MRPTQSDGHGLSDTELAQARGPIGGSGAPSGGKFEIEAARDAQRFGLDRLCPTIDDAMYEIERAVMAAGGESFNPESLQRLIESHGLSACWCQAMVLQDRLDRNPRIVTKVTPFYIQCVRNNSAPPAGTNLSRLSGEWHARLCSGKANLKDVPDTVRERVDLMLAAQRQGWHPWDSVSGESPDAIEF